MKSTELENKTFTTRISHFRVFPKFLVSIFYSSFFIFCVYFSFYSFSSLIGISKFFPTSFLSISYADNLEFRSSESEEIYGFELAEARGNNQGGRFQVGVGRASGNNQRVQTSSSGKDSEVGGGPVRPTPPTPPIPPIQIGVGEGREGVINAMRIMILLTILTLVPSLLVLITSFTRIVIVLFLLRQAIGVIQVPPNQVIIGLALFLSIFIMRPAIEDGYKNAFVPYAEGKIPEEVFFSRAFEPFKKFMLAQVGEKELDVFVKIAGKNRPSSPSDITADVLIPAFIVSEIKKAFEIGFLIYIPFVIIDITIASVLMAMGMIMVPPIMLSIPFKLIVFVLADGWNLLIASLVGSFAVK